jgi:sugar transferase EpsL
MAKRLFDLFLCLLFLPFWVPLLCLVAVLSRMLLGSPIFFRQLRPGKHGKCFELLKFRTMSDLKDGSGRLLADHLRISRFGSWLRSTSLDELPEIFNVLRGDMSFVGPRPLLPQYLTRYTSRQLRRHEVLPGITGWAQINGRNEITWEQKFEYDLYYVEHRSFLFDVKILFLTFWRALIREGISAPGHETMPEFLGTDLEEPANKTKSQ